MSALTTKVTPESRSLVLILPADAEDWVVQGGCRIRHCKLPCSRLPPAGLVQLATSLKDWTMYISSNQQVGMGAFGPVRQVIRHQES